MNFKRAATTKDTADTSSPVISMDSVPVSRTASSMLKKDVSDKRPVAVAQPAATIASRTGRSNSAVAVNGGSNSSGRQAAVSSQKPSPASSVSSLGSVTGMAPSKLTHRAVVASGQRPQPGHKPGKPPSPAPGRRLAKIGQIPAKADYVVSTSGFSVEKLPPKLPPASKTNSRHGPPLSPNLEPLASSKKLNTIKTSPVLGTRRAYQMVSSSGSSSSSSEVAKTTQTCRANGGRPIWTQKSETAATKLASVLSVNKRFPVRHSDTEKETDCDRKFSPLKRISPEGNKEGGLKSSLSAGRVGDSGRGGAGLTAKTPIAAAGWPMSAAGNGPSLGMGVARVQCIPAGGRPPPNPNLAPAATGRISDPEARTTTPIQGASGTKVTIIKFVSLLIHSH